MTTEVRWRGTARTPRSPGAVAVLCAAFLILYLVTVHAQHFFAPETRPSADVSATHAAHALGSQAASMAETMGAAVMDCPFPGIFARSIETASDVVFVQLWWLASLVIVMLLPRGVPTAVPPPRPAGPARQALLQRFLL